MSSRGTGGDVVDMVAMATLWLSWQRMADEFSFSRLEDLYYVLTDSFACQLL